MSNSFYTMLNSIQGSRILNEAVHLMRAKRIEALTNSLNVISDFVKMEKTRDNIAHMIVKATTEDV